MDPETGEWIELRPRAVRVAPLPNASLCWVTGRSLTMYPPGSVVYHLPTNRDYRTHTWCGLVIWSNDGVDSGLVPMRIDNAESFARLCAGCSRAALGSRAAEEGR